MVLQCPKHRQHLDSFCTICGTIAAINKERKMVAIQKERLGLDKELLKAEKRNHKRALKVQAASGLSASEQDDLRKRVARLETELSDQRMQHEKELVSMQVQMKTLKEQHQMKELELTLKVSRQEEQIDKKIKQFDKERQEFTENIAVLEKEGEAIKLELEEAGEKKNHVEEQVEILEMKEEMEGLKKQLEEKEREASTRSVDQSSQLTAQIKQLESREADVEDLKEQLSDAEAERDNYRAQVQTLEDRVKSIREQQQAQQAEAADVTEICTNCEDLEEEVYDLKLKLNRSQVESQSQIKALEEDLEQAKQGNMQIAGAAAKTFVTASELQELRRVETEKKKVQDKFLALEALQKTTEKEHETTKRNLAELRDDNYKLALELEDLQKNAPDQEEWMKLKNEMDTLQMKHEGYMKNQRMEEQDFVDLVELLDKKQQQVFDQDIPDFAARIQELEGKLTEVENIKLEANSATQEQLPGDIVSKPTPNNAESCISERPPPLTKVDSHKNRHITEFQYGERQSGKSGKYTGFIDSNDVPQGHGILRVDNGDVYEGDWKDGKRHGQGVYTWYDGDLYTGPWKQGRRHGHGVFVFSDGRLYDGEYNNGQREGLGMFVWPYGAKYEGTYHADKRNGQGEYVYADGRTYRGEYKDDRPHGYGVETDKDEGVIYDGHWVYGEFVGADGTGSVMGSIAG